MTLDPAEQELLDAGAELVVLTEGDAQIIWTRQRVHDLLDELDITSGALREAMLNDPERARAVLQHAKGSVGIRNPASFAIANWRAGFDPRGRSERSEERELDEQAPTLSAIELAWHLEERGSAVAPFVLAMMLAAIARNGGFRPVLEAGFRLRERYDDDGELVERELVTDEQLRLSSA